MRVEAEPAPLWRFETFYTGSRVLVYLNLNRIDLNIVRDISLYCVCYESKTDHFGLGHPGAEGEERREICQGKIGGSVPLGEMDKAGQGIPGLAPALRGMQTERDHKAR